MVELLVQLATYLSQLLLEILLFGPGPPDLVLDLLGLFLSELLLLDFLPLLLLHVLHFRNSQGLFIHRDLCCQKLLVQLSELAVELVDVEEEALGFSLDAVDLVLSLLNVVLDSLKLLLDFSLLLLVPLTVRCLSDDALLFSSELLNFPLCGFRRGL